MDNKLYYVGDRTVCADCIYFKKNTGNVNATASYCNYCEMEGHSRIYSQKEISKRIVPKGWCDKYLSKEDYVWQSVRK
jgi:hypothetical protein